MNLVLIGFKNSGKTTIGSLIAEQTNKTFIDLDVLIAQHEASFSVREIYKLKGEEYFRNVEKQLISKLQVITNTVIASGGGVVLNNQNILHLKKIGQIIYLESCPKILLDRLKNEPYPAFLDPIDLEKSFFKVYNQRKELYKKAADLKINTDFKTIIEIATEILLHLQSEEKVPAL